DPDPDGKTAQRLFRRTPQTILTQARPARHGVSEESVGCTAANPVRRDENLQRRCENHRTSESCTSRRRSKWQKPDFDYRTVSPLDRLDRKAAWRRRRAESKGGSAETGRQPALNGDLLFCRRQSEPVVEKGRQPGAAGEIVDRAIGDVLVALLGARHLHAV